MHLEHVKHCPETRGFKTAETGSPHSDDKDGKGNLLLEARCEVNWELFALSVEEVGGVAIREGWRETDRRGGMSSVFKSV